MKEIVIPGKKELMYSDIGFNVATFVGSDTFGSFLTLVRTLPTRNLLSSFIGQFDEENPVLTWVQGNSRKGVSFGLTTDEYIKYDGDRNILFRSGGRVPQMLLKDEKGRNLNAEQLTIMIADQNITPEGWDPAYVAENTRRFIGVQYETVRMNILGRPDAKPVATMGLSIHLNGDISVMLNKTLMPGFNDMFKRGMDIKELDHRLSEFV